MENQTNPPESRPPVEERSKSSSRNFAIYAIVALVLITIIALGLANTFGRRLTEAPVRDIPKGPPVTAQPVTPPPLTPPVTEMPQTEVKPGEPTPEKQAPPEVVRYLAHLKNVEKYRQNMRNDVGPALMMLKDAYASQLGLGEDDDLTSQRQLKTGYSKYIQDWQNLTRYFQALPPPEPCRQLAYEYGEGLAAYVKVMSSIQISMSEGDISALLGLRGSAQANVNDRLSAADDELEKVCDTFDLKKEFRISEDSSVGSLIGL